MKRKRIRVTLFLSRPQAETTAALMHSAMQVTEDRHVRVTATAAWKTIEAALAANPEERDDA